MCYFMVVSLILQAPFTLGNVTSHPNHHEIKMFPFNVIKDNNNIPTEKTACILIRYKSTISCWKYSTVPPPPQHAALRSTFRQKTPSWRGSRWLLVPSSSTPHLLYWGRNCSSFPRSGPSPDGTGVMLRSRAQPASRRRISALLVFLLSLQPSRGKF